MERPQCRFIQENENAFIQENENENENTSNNKAVHYLEYW